MTEDFPRSAEAASIVMAGIAAAMRNARERRERREEEKFSELFKKKTIMERIRKVEGVLEETENCKIFGLHPEEERIMVERQDMIKQCVSPKDLTPFARSLIVRSASIVAGIR